MVKLIPSTHPAVYQYVKGGPQSKNSAIMRTTEIIYEWCNPYWTGDDTITIEFVRGVSRQYLAHMEAEWKKGRIKLKEIYQNVS